MQCSHCAGRYAVQSMVTAHAMLSVIALGQAAWRSAILHPQYTLSTWQAAVDTALMLTHMHHVVQVIVTSTGTSVHTLCWCSMYSHVGRCGVVQQCREAFHSSRWCLDNTGERSLAARGWATAQAEVNLVTALVPSETACLASSPGRMRRTAVWISREVTVGFLL